MENGGVREPGKQPEKKSGASTCLKVGLIGCALLLVVGGVGGWLIVRNIPRWTRSALLSGARMMAVEVIDGSGMSAEEKKEFTGHVDRLVEGAKAGKVSNEQLKQMMEKLAASPLIPMAIVKAADAKYVQPSGLSAEEKKRGKLDLQRLGRGVTEKNASGDPKIGQKDLDEILALISTADAQGNRRVKEKLTDEEVRAFLAKVREKADAASIPEEPYEVKPAEEFGRIVDEVLGEAK
jgi:hypothetical protein